MWAILQLSWNREKSTTSAYVSDFELLVVEYAVYAIVLCQQCTVQQSETKYGQPNVKLKDKESIVNAVA